jgi:hypothetical protein
VALRFLPLPAAVLGPLTLTFDAAAAGAGLLLATYTGVLLAVTAIPVWAAHVRTLPIHFAASSLGAAASLLELVGHRAAALNTVALGAAAVVLLLWVAAEIRRDAASRPLHTGRSGRLVRAGDALAGLVPVVLRLTAAGSPVLRLLAASAAVAGSLVTRFGWLAAGRASAADPDAILNPGSR